MSNVIQMPAGASPFDSIKRVRPDGSEYWSARDLMPLLGYIEWRKFDGAIDRAKIAAEVQGHDVSSLFVGAAKVSGTRGPAQQDYEMARFAAYLTAMNGDPRKPEIAAAMAYFAVQTHVAETAAQSPAIPQTYSEALRAAADATDRAELEAARAAEQQKIADQRQRAIEAQAPKVAKAEAHSASKEWKGRQEFAREVQHWGRRWGYRILHESVYELLRRKKMLIAGNRRDRNHATALAEERGWATTEKGTDEKTGRPWKVARLSPKGQDIAWKWINEAAEQFGDGLNPKQEEVA